MNRNLATANTRVKQLVAGAYREVANQPNSFESVKFLRKVGAQVRKLGQSVPVTATAIKSDSWMDNAAKKIEKIENVVEGGFEFIPVEKTDDDLLVRLANTQVRNTIRPVNFLKPIKDNLNAKTPDWTSAADGIATMADSLELGLHLAEGNTSKAKRIASRLTVNGYVPSSVVRHVLH